MEVEQFRVLPADQSSVPKSAVGLPMALN